MMDVDVLERNVREASGLLKCLSNDRRLMIVCELSSGEKSVGALEERVGLTQSALSQHLARLRKDGIVRTRRDSQRIYYSLVDANVTRMLETLAELYCPTGSEEA
ncbi:ArsR/SmtB family transcription factor [Magnetospira sp. QH-2]|uniref:ArsR/SmtB family transcription factor n=1 Tax=Magnetospira sp. (strain QH-2) TaxID=1288970 RepID=UPI000A912CE6